jgi:hypothetical protein
MANGVYALMHTMEPPFPHPPIQLRPAQAQRHELTAGDYAVLAARKR